MTSEDFVDAVREFVVRSAASDTVLNYNAPPGRRPDEHLLRLSCWYKGLADRDKAMVAEVAGDAALAAAFGLLAVLDGARVVEDPEDRGEFELWYVRDGERELLTSAASVGGLHDLLNAVEPPDGSDAEKPGEGDSSGDE